ncbi:MAG: AgmX/PglI C-terminal domain-containing protein [Polyangiaceae bacterium]|nr:AgmX/PglI C-terminal domain-containing protein [Polyangiaceae bacterium]
MSRLVALVAAAALVTACAKSEERAASEPARAPPASASVPVEPPATATGPDAAVVPSPAPAPPPTNAAASEREAAAFALLLGNQKLDGLPVQATDDGAPVEPSLRHSLLSRPQPVTIRFGPVQSSEGLRKEVIQRVLRQRLPLFRECYSRGLARNPSLSGTVHASLVIDPSGKVKTTTRADVPDTEVIRCVANVINGVTMPKPEGGVTVRASIALTLTPAR